MFGRRRKKEEPKVAPLKPKSKPEPHTLRDVESAADHLMQLVKELELVSRERNGGNGVT